MRGLGYIPDPPELNFGDEVIAGTQLLGENTLPHSASATHFLPDVMDQFDHNSCVAEAVAGLVFAGMSKAGLEPDELLSRAYLWWRCRNALGVEDFNSGCYIRGAFEMLEREGFCRERHFPHSTQYDIAPRPFVQNYAHDQRDTGDAVVYRRLIEPHGPDRVQAIKEAIASGYPVVGGVDIPRSFHHIDGIDTWEPDPEEPIVGGHAMVMHAFGPRGMKVRNSWGSDWGDGGDCWITEAWAGRWRDIWVALRVPAFSEPP